MLKELGKEYQSPEERRAFLSDNCDGVENKSYMRPFTPDQMATKKEQLANLSINIADIEDEKKAANDVFKRRLNPLQNQKNVLLMEIKSKAEYVKGEDLYKFINTDTKMVGYYNAEGDLVEERQAFGNELHGTIFQMARNAQ